MPAADNNWRIQPVPGVKLRFVSSAKGVAHLAAQPAIKLVQEQAEGLALYELVQ
jgi:2',3'-cyclic-nucleotide 2'-phosphodiesterase/3'-nucleotidase